MKQTNLLLVLLAFVVVDKIFFMSFCVYNILTAIGFFFITIYSFVCVCFSFAFQCVCFADEMYINIYDCFFIATLYNDLRLTCCCFLQIV